MGFHNELTGQNGTLIYPQVKSPNFETGVSGWEIRKDGSAEFNNLDVRGTFVGSSYIVNEDGIFFYSGTPANGNLIGVWAAVAGEDGFGNTYDSGWTSQDAIAKLNIGTGSNATTQTWDTGNPNILGSAVTQSAQGSVGGTLYDQFAIVSAVDKTLKDHVSILMTSANQNNTVAATIKFLYSVLGGGNGNFLQMSYGGLNLVGKIVAVDPTTGTSPSNIASNETWHTAALNLGFTAHASDQAPRYRVEPVGSGLVCRLDGTVYTSLAVASGAVMFSLPVQYAPATRKRFVGSTNFSGYGLGNMTAGVSITGDITCGMSANAAGQQLVLDGMTFPLD